MKARFLDNSDIPTLEKWFKGQNALVPLREDYPEVGFIVDGVCAGFLARTDTQYALLELFVANPGCGGRTVSEGFDVLIAALEEEAKERGYAYLLAVTSSGGLARKYKKKFGAADVAPRKHVVYKLFRS